MSRIGFNADRTIRLESEFVRPPNLDARCSSASIEMFGHTYEVKVEIDGRDDLRLPGGETHGKDADPDRQNARQWMALCELAQRPTRDFEKCSGESPHIDVSIPEPPNARRHWTIEELRNYVHRKLAGYNIEEWRPSLWKAQPKEDR